MADKEADYAELRRLVGLYGLAGAGEACEILGIKTAGLPPMRRRNPDFPAALKQLKAGPVFIEAEILEEAQRRKGK